jgi:hypothetical protein
VQIANVVFDSCFSVLYRTKAPFKRPACVVLQSMKLWSIP